MSRTEQTQTKPYLLPQGVIPRAVAFIIDLVLVLTVVYVLLWLTGRGSALPSVTEGTGLRDIPDLARDYGATSEGIRVTILIYTVIVVYTLVVEAAWGRTLGKSLLGLEVVRDKDGGPCGWPRSLVRNIIRPFDVLFFYGMPGALVVMVTKRRQRLGDLAAGTLVVRRLPALPSFAGVPMPGVLKRCEGCGGLVEAAGSCRRCGRPPAPADVPRPIAAMMAVGQATADLSLAAQELLAVETAFMRASSEEYERLDGATSDADAPAAGAADATGAGEADRSPSGPAAPEEGDVAGEDETRVEADEAEPWSGGDERRSDGEDGGDAGSPEDDDAYSAAYVDAWNDLLTAARTLRRRHGLFEEAAQKAGLKADQAATMQPELAHRLEELAGYLEASDDEAVFAAFRERALSSPAV
jgi:uncharacterized RDD family membrane protein YckC